MLYKRILTCVLSMWTCQKIFLTSKFSYLLFCNPTHKTAKEDCIYVGTTNSKPPGLIIMIGQSKTGNSSQIIFITLFSSLPGAQLCCGFHRPQQICRRMTIFLTHTCIYVNFSWSNFNVQGRILSTHGVALRVVL
jgi:hypothetical protein